MTREFSDYELNHAPLCVNHADRPKEPIVNKTMLERSLKNCHCDGVDSLVIRDAPKMVRIFMAHQHHNLYRNKVEVAGTNYTFSVAMHRHHCNVTLMPLSGEIYNVLFSEAEDAVTVPLTSFVYQSPITNGGEGRFVQGDALPIPMRLKMLQLTQPVHMRANVLHTVYVPYGKPAAWLVWEGDEDPAYNLTVYTNADLTKFDFTGLNQKMTETEVIASLTELGVEL